MTQSEKGTSILKLKVNEKENKIEWFYTPVDLLVHGWYPKFKSEALDLSDLTRRTIEFFVNQLQLLAGMVYTANDKTLQTQLPNFKVDTTATDLIKLLGEHLYNVLFKGEILKNLNKGLNDALLLRVELEFEDDDGKLEALPWEYLYRPKDKAIDNDAFLVQIAQLVLNRKLSLEDAPYVPLGVPKPVKVLLVVSTPTDLGEVICNPVLTKLKELAEKTPPLIDYRVLNDKLDRNMPEPPDKEKLLATIDKFAEYVRDFEPNIIHFIGHGRRNGDHGQIAFVGHNGKSNWVNDDDFANWATQSKAKLKLVFLQACDTAHNSISGMTYKLAYKNIPAVLAMQYQIESGIANDFACGFYNELAKGKSVDMAVKGGRQAIKLPNNNQQLSYAFGLPVLYLSSYDSIINDDIVDDTKSGSASLLTASSPGLSRIVCPNPSCRKEQPKRRGCIKCGLAFQCMYCNFEFDDPTDEEQLYCGNCWKAVRCRQCKKQLLDEDKGFDLCSSCRSKQQQHIPIDSPPIAV